MPSRHTVSSAVLGWSQRPPWFSANSSGPASPGSSCKLAATDAEMERAFSRGEKGILEVWEAGRTEHIVLKIRTTFTLRGGEELGRAPSGLLGEPVMFYFLISVLVIGTYLLCEKSLNTMCLLFYMYVMLQ